MKILPLIAFSFVLVFVNNAVSQLKYTDLYFAELKGNVKSAILITIAFDTTDFSYGFDTKVISDYNQNGNCSNETEFRGTDTIQTSVSIFEIVNGREKRIKKVTTHAVDPANKTIHSYFSDETGFDTSIVVCTLDSAYFMRYKHKKNEFGLRCYGAEFNALNGNKNYSYEISYSKKDSIDSITYLDRFDKVKYTAHYQYNESGLIGLVNYSDGGSTKYNYSKFDSVGNWTELEVLYLTTSTSELISKTVRTITYY